MKEVGKDNTTFRMLQVMIWSKTKRAGNLRTQDGTFFDDAHQVYDFYKLMWFALKNVKLNERCNRNLVSFNLLDLTCNKLLWFHDEKNCPWTKNQTEKKNSSLLNVTT